MHTEQKIKLLEIALHTAALINKKEVEIPCMGAGYEDQGSVEKLLDDAEKIYHFLTKNC